MYIYLYCDQIHDNMIHLYDINIYVQQTYISKWKKPHDPRQLRILSLPLSIAVTFKH